MAQKKNPADRQAEPAQTPVQPLQPAVPPPDNPRRRSEEFDADREFESKELAARRLKALRETLEMRCEDEDPPAENHDPPLRTPKNA